MNRLLAYLGRLVVILGGFMFAALGASAFLHLLFLGGLSWDVERAGDAAYVAGSFVLSVPFVALFVGYFGLVPAAVLILIAELLGRRDWLYFALAGGAAGLAVAYGYGFLVRAEGAIDPTTLLLSLAATGMVAGLCYWLVAGRSSGEWLHGRARPTA